MGPPTINLTTILVCSISGQLLLQVNSQLFLRTFLIYLIYSYCTDQAPRYLIQRWFLLFRSSSYYGVHRYDIYWLKSFHQPQYICSPYLFTFDVTPIAFTIFGMSNAIVVSSALNLQYFLTLPSSLPFRSSLISWFRECEPFHFSTGNRIWK